MTRKVSKYQALFRYFPDRPWSTEYATLRTVKITGRPLGDEHDAVKAGIARLISGDYARKADREARARRGRAIHREELERTARGLPLEGTSRDLALSDAAAEAFLASLESSKSSIVGPNDTPASPQLARVMGAETVDLRLVDEDSEVQGAIFPTLFLCETCHRYYNLDPNGAENLRCSFHENDSDLRQLNVVYSCARCANIEPLLPYNIFARKLPAGWVRCTAGHGVFLEIGASLSDARWRCESVDCPSGISGQRVNRLCALCNISDDELRAGETKSVMAPRSATSGEIAVPLTVTYVRDAQGRDIQLDNLKAQHRQAPGSFTLATVEPSAAARFRSLSATDAFDVPHVQSLLAVYGYRSEVRPRPSVPDDERYPRYFQPQPGVQRFRAFATVTDGRGVVIGLDKARLARFVVRERGGNSSYDTLVAEEMAGIEEIGLQDLLAADEDRRLFPITKLLHALEHALRTSLITEIGLDDFDSRILAADAGLLFFETRDLADGGITQLSQHSGLMTNWLVRAIRRIEECPQLCKSSCIACVKTSNAACHGFLTREFGRWMPPNILVDRTLACDWIRQNAR